MGELVLRMVMSLAVVMGLLLLAIRFAGRKYRTNSAATVSVLHRQALTRGSGVTVVQVGQRVLVLGTTEQQVRVLAEMDPSELAAPAESAHTYADSAQAEVGPTPSFADSTRHRAELRAVPAPKPPGSCTGPDTGADARPGSVADLRKRR